VAPEKRCPQGLKPVDFAPLAARLNRLRKKMKRDFIPQKRRDGAAVLRGREERFLSTQADPSPLCERSG